VGGCVSVSVCVSVCGHCLAGAAGYLSQVFKYIRVHMCIMCIKGTCV